jgi:hypothetical protein
MRWLTGLAVLGGLLLGQASTARAQNDMNGFGSYPAGITTGSPATYDPFARGYYEERYGYPFTYSYQSYPMYGATSAVPRATTFYGSGYSSYTYPGTYAGFPSNAYAYPSYGYGFPSYRYAYPSYGYAYLAYGYTSRYWSPSYSYGRPGLYGGYRRWGW